MKFLLAFLLGLGFAGGFSAAIYIGHTDGIAEVLASCSNYGKYHLAWTADEITCTGPFDPSQLDLSVDKLTAKLYSKENKFLHRKERK